MSLDLKPNVDLFGEAGHMAETLNKDFKHLMETFAKIEDKDFTVAQLINDRDGNPLLNIRLCLGKFASAMGSIMDSEFPADMRGFEQLKHITDTACSYLMDERSIGKFLNFKHWLNEVKNLQRKMHELISYRPKIEDAAAGMVFLDDVAKTYRNIFCSISGFARTYNIKIPDSMPELKFSFKDKVHGTSLRPIAFYEQARKSIVLMRPFFLDYDAYSRQMVLAHEIFHYVHYEAERLPWVMPRIIFAENWQDIVSGAGPGLRLINRVSKGRKELLLWHFISKFASHLKKIADRTDDKKFQLYLQRFEPQALIDAKTYSSEVKHSSEMLYDYFSFIYKHLIMPFYEMTDFVIDSYDTVKNTSDEKSYEELYHKLPRELYERAGHFISERNRFYKGRDEFIKPVYKHLALLFLDDDATRLINDWTKRLLNKSVKVLDHSSPPEEFKRQANLLFEILRKPEHFIRTYMSGGEKITDEELLDADIASGLLLSSDQKGVTNTVLSGFMVEMVMDLEHTYNEGIVDYMRVMFMEKYFGEGFRNKWKTIEKMMEESPLGYPKARYRIFKSGKERKRIGFAHFMVLMAQHMGYIKLVH